MQARILYVDATTKKIMLSLQPELESMTVRSLPNIGDVFEVRHEKKKDRDKRKSYTVKRYKPCQEAWVIKHTKLHSYWVALDGPTAS